MEVDRRPSVGGNARGPQVPLDLACRGAPGHATERKEPQALRVGVDAALTGALGDKVLAQPRNLLINIHRLSAARAKLRRALRGH